MLYSLEHKGILVCFPKNNVGSPIVNAVNLENLIGADYWQDLRRCTTIGATFNNIITFTLCIKRDKIKRR